MALPMPHKLFSIEEYEQMIEAGILHEDDRIELLRGEIVEMAPIGLRHSGCVARLEYLLHDIMGKKAIVWTQNPILLPNDSMPEPDVALLRWRDDFYTQSRPTPEDVLLLVEVADTSLFPDRIAKVPIYAEAGIKHFWLVNLVENQIEVYSNPKGGKYSDTKKAKRGGSLRLPVDPGTILNVDDIIV
jgi:Uma2 family endonuclease